MNIQNELFPDDRYQPPITSAMAKQKFAPKAGTYLDRMLIVWREREGTAEEIAAICHQRYGGKTESYRKTKRVLKDRGCLQLVGIRECATSGYKAEVYRGIKP
jgi:hypothetical protein